MRNADLTDQWITNVRARLAARKNGRPSTKAGAVRALWPEIQQALQNGQTLKSIRDWLEAEGVPLRYSQLTSYVRRIRRKQGQGSEVLSQAEHGPTTQADDRAEDDQPVPEPGPVTRDPLANLRSREGRPCTFEYNPEFKEEELL
jgi:hypothetical protein